MVAAAVAPAWVMNCPPLLRAAQRLPPADH